MVDFGVGLTSPYVNSLVAPYTDGILAPLGSYKDEARTALIGVALYKMGSGVIQAAGKEYFRLALLSAGAQTGANFTGGAAQATNYNQGQIYG